MILKSGIISYKCTGMRTNGDARTFILSDKPTKIIDIAKLISDDNMELVSINPSDYVFQYINGSGPVWTLEFTNVEYIPPTPTPEPEPSDFDMNEFILGLAGVIDA